MNKSQFARITKTEPPERWGQRMSEILEKRERDLYETVEKARIESKEIAIAAVENLKRTDDTQMSEDRIYDEAIEDAVKLFNRLA